METFLGHPGFQIWQLQIFFMGLPEGKGVPNKAQDLTKTKGLSSQRNPWHTAGNTDISDGVCGTANTALCGSPWRSLTVSDFQDIICGQSPICALPFPPYIFCKIYFFLSVLVFETQS
jgi:hypothetical protein